MPWCSTKKAFMLILNSTLWETLKEKISAIPGGKADQKERPLSPQQMNLLNVIAQAFNNQSKPCLIVTSFYLTIFAVKICWDAEQFAATTPKQRLKKFPKINLGKIDVPAIITDCRGRILIWYLPGVLLLPEQVSAIWL
jgi:hypothetical protein